MPRPITPDDPEYREADEPLPLFGTPDQTPEQRERAARDAVSHAVFGPPRARATDPETSHEAAASMPEGAAAQRARIVALFAAHPRLTADRVDELLGWRPTTAGRRFKELREAGVLRVAMQDGQPVRELTRSERWAEVHELTIGGAE